MSPKNDEWFDVYEFPDRIIGIGEPGHIEDVKAYLVLGSERSLMVDSGLGFGNIRAVVDALTDGPILLVNTHGHLDHIGDNWRFERRWVHEGDLERVRKGLSNAQLSRFLKPNAFSRTPPPDFDPSTFHIRPADVERTVADDEVIDLGDRTFRVIHVPGHTPGCIAFLEESTGILISGDIVHEGAMFAHYPGGSAHEYRDSLRRLDELVQSLSVVYPSHNRYPIEPWSVSDARGAMDEIWEGRQPDQTGDGLCRFDFGKFSFTVREGWRDEE